MPEKSQAWKPAQRCVMLELDAILEAATDAVEQDYFLLPIDGGDAIYRERVYCYELYHQLRSRWPEGCEYVLNGEVDKRGHQLLAEFGADNAVPDFLVHKPGDNSMNHAIIEVKSQEVTPAGCLADLAKLKRFMANGVDYTRGIFLIYGRSARQALENAMQSRQFDAGEVELWLHEKAGFPAKRHTGLSRILS